MQLNGRRLWSGTLCVLALLWGSAHAAMQLDRTRVIVTETDNRAIVNASNTGAQPLILQVWITPSASDSNQEDIVAVTTAQAITPFLVDPPVVRLDAEQTQALSVWFTQTPQTLPKDRESQFWLNVLEIPAETPNAGGEDTNRLALSVVTQIKVFYRPEDLADYQRSDEDKLRFSVTRDDQGTFWLQLENPAPIHQTIEKLTLHQKETEIPVKLTQPMLAPFAKNRVQLAQTLTTPHTVRVAFVMLDDQGQLVEDEQAM